MKQIKRIIQRLKEREQPEEDASSSVQLPPINITQNIRENFGKVTGAIINLPDPNAERLRDARAILLQRVKSAWIEEPGAARHRQAALQAIETEHNAFVQGIGLLPLHKQFLPDAVDFVSHSTNVVAHLDRNEAGDTNIINPERPIYELFNEARQALLILGEPGVGKTVTLLQLARDAIRDAEADAEKPAPVILDLAAWVSEQLPIADWIVRELNTIQYGIPKAITQSWLKRNDLLLLLDGLSELAAPQRRRCVERLNEFIKDYGLVGIVVCCRTEEYKLLPIQLMLHEAIVIDSLSKSQLDAYFEIAGDNLAGLRTALAQDAVLHELAMTPLMLHIMSVAYADVESAEIAAEQQTSFERQYKHLFDVYIKRMFRYGGEGGKPYPDSQTKEWLSWLAQQMEAHNHAIFLIERMQPSWLTTLWQGWAYALATRLGYGIVLGTLFALLLLLGDGLILGVSVVGENLRFSSDDLPLLARSVLFFWIAAGLALGCLEIALWSLLKISIRPVTIFLTKILLYIVTIGIAGGVTFALLHDRWWSGGIFYGQLLGVLGGLFLALSVRARRIQSEIRTVEKLQISWLDAFRGILFGILLGGLLGVGLDIAVSFQFFHWFWPTLEPDWLRRLLAAITLVSPVIALFGIIFGGFRGILLESKIRSNQGTRLSAWNALYVGIACTFLGWLLAFIYARVGQAYVPADYSQLATGGPLNGLVVGLLCGSLAALWHGGLNLIQHGILRLILYTEGSAPLNYTQFLDYCVDRVFLRRIGGGYIFINRLLLEHFAKETVSIRVEVHQPSVPDLMPQPGTNLLSQQTLQSVLRSIRNQLENLSILRFLTRISALTTHYISEKQWSKHLSRLAQGLVVSLGIIFAIYLLWQAYGLLSSSLQHLPGLLRAEPSDNVTIDSYREAPYARRVWEWLDLLIASLLFVIGGFLFYRTQQRNEQRAAEQWQVAEQRLIESHARESALQTYLDRMARLMLDNNSGKRNINDEAIADAGQGGSHRIEVDQSIVEMQPGATAVGVQLFDGDSAYDVRGLKNPYLGLRAFTYDDRTAFAGREELIDSGVRMLTTPGEQRILLFITGASGSGKSSFAQAGLVPALETYYQERGRTVVKAVFRPSRQPLPGLANALSQLGLLTEGLFTDVLAYMSSSVYKSAAPNWMSLLIIDQFEEMFTQSDPYQRDKLFAILESLLASALLNIHIIITMRTDYLPDLLIRKPLHALAKQGIELRVMSGDELTSAIQRPLQTAYLTAGKRFQEALLKKLVEDASESASLLPLLQVTLEELWRGGFLTVDKYDNLSDAIRERADHIYAFVKDTYGQPKARSTLEQTKISEIFLDLVKVSLDDDSHTDVRQRRNLLELAKQDLQRRRLIYELSTVRLLSIESEIDPETQEGVDVVDIIHDSLISAWPKLHHVIDEKRDYLQQRTRFEINFNEWKREKQSKAFLLEGVRLQEAENLSEANDVALYDPDAQDYLRRSIQQRDRKRQRRLYTTSITSIVLGVLSIIAVIATMNVRGALMQARSRQIAEVARNSRMTADPQKSLLLSLVALDQIADTVQARQALRESLRDWRRMGIDKDCLLPNAEFVLGQWGHRLATYNPQLEGSERLLHLWSSYVTEELIGCTQQVVNLTISDEVRSVKFSDDGQYVAVLTDRKAAIVHVDSGELVSQVDRQSSTPHDNICIRLKSTPSLMTTCPYSNTVQIWDWATEQGSPIPTQQPLRTKGQITALDLSAHARLLIVGSNDGSAYLWEVGSENRLRRLGGFEGDVNIVSFSPDMVHLATKSAGILNLFILPQARGQLESNKLFGSEELLNCDKQIQSLGQTPEERRAEIRKIKESGFTCLQILKSNVQITAIAFSPNSRFLAAGSEDGNLRIWNLYEPEYEMTLLKESHADAVRGIAFSPDSRLMATIGEDNSVRLWRIDLQALQAVIPIQQGVNATLEFDTDGRFWTILDNQGHISFQRIQSGDNPAYYIAHDNLIHSLALLKGTTQVIVAAGGSKVIRLDLASGAEKSIKINGAHPSTLAVSEDNQYVAVGSADGYIHIHNLKDAKDENIGRWPAHVNGVRTLLFLPGSEHLVSGGGGGVIRIWNWRTGTEYKSLLGHTDDVNNLALDTNTNLLYSASSDGTVREWNWSTGNQKQIITSTFPLLAVAANENFVAAGGYKNHIHLWKRTEDKVESIYPDSYTRTMAFAPGDRLVSGHENGNIKIWNLATKQGGYIEEETIRAHAPGWVMDLEIDSIGELLYSVGGDGLMRTWPLDADDLIRWTCQRQAGTDLDQENIREEFVPFIDKIQICETQSLPFLFANSAFNRVESSPVMTDGVAPPVIHYFESVSGSSIGAEEALHLRWNVSNAKEVYINYGEGNQGQKGVDERAFADIKQDTTARLIVIGKDENVYTQTLKITIQ